MDRQSFFDKRAKQVAALDLELRNPMDKVMSEKNLDHCLCFLRLGPRNCIKISRSVTACGCLLMLAREWGLDVAASPILIGTA
jgi:hypothetical protein